MSPTASASTPGRGPRLEVRGLRKRFRTRAVLAGVDLDVGPGEVVLLAGGNGSGKTTLLRCVAGLARHEGTIAVDGHVLGRGPRSRSAIGYLPQAIGLPTWATATEVLQLFARLRGVATDMEAIVARLDDTGLVGFLPPLDQPVGELSGGQRQRVAVAVALLGRPSLLLLDEPTANLDDEGRAAMVSVLEVVAASGTSVLIAAPSPGDLNGLPDRTVRLSDGRLAEGRLAEGQLATERAGSERLGRASDGVVVELSRDARSSHPARQERASHTAAPSAEPFAGSSGSRKQVQL